MTLQPLEHLSSPPIFEVICGHVFEPIQELTPVSLGKYWEKKRTQYPTHQLLPALADELTFVMGGIAPLRVWFVSKDDEFVLQFQSDRFYINWRARERQYPRFRDHDGKQGILSRASAEFAEFEAFCREAFGTVPKLRRIELAKVDQLVEGKHWRGIEDLGRLVPSLQAVAAISTFGDPSFTVRVHDTRPKGYLAVSLDTSQQPQADGRQVRVLKIETRTAKELSGRADIQDLFREANDELNDAFAKLIPERERQRFR